MGSIKVYLGADHRGFKAKQDILALLKKSGYDVEDDSNTLLNPDDDYPIFAQKVASRIKTSKDIDARGILICGSGQGMCMAANRFKGIRAALGHSEQSVRAARNDDDANVLCLPAELIEAGEYEQVIHSFLKTPFAAAPRYIRRIREMDDL